MLFKKNYSKLEEKIKLLENKVSVAMTISEGALRTMYRIANHLKIEPKDLSGVFRDEDIDAYMDCIMMETQKRIEDLLGGNDDKKEPKK